MKRAEPPAMKRNAAVVLGNVGTAADADVLTRALDDPEPLVRQHAAWALGRVGGADAAIRLRDRAPVEADPCVLEELREGACQARALTTPEVEMTRREGCLCARTPPRRSVRPGPRRRPWPSAPA
jgi:HEAT repeat protein